MVDGKSSEMNHEISVLYEDNHIIVIEKPVNVPVQEDASQDMDVLRLVKNYVKEKYNKPGDVFIGLVHRLDRPVGGVMVFARTSKAASRLSDQVRTNRIDKIYRAVIIGAMEQTDGVLLDYLVKNTKTNTVTTTTKTDKLGKLARLSYNTIKCKNELSMVEVALDTGRSHQIRVQFASRKHALWGDQRYNKTAKVGQQIALWAVRLSFDHPTTKERMTFTSNPPNQYPWDLF